MLYFTPYSKNALFQLLAYINYWLRQVDDHSLHSPFLFKFYNELIKQEHKVDEQIESLRDKLKQNTESITLQDFGAGSRVSNSKERNINQIARHASTPARFSVFLRELIDYLKLETVVELGTSLGLNTLYLSTNTRTKVFTFEGDPSVAKLAQQNFDESKRSNIELIQGNIDHTYQEVLPRIARIDLAYLDANHRYEPTLKYFDLSLEKCHDKSVIVLDDIHWSKEMQRAWDELRQRPEVSLSLDLFEAGILFLDPELPNEHYILKF